jgi:hypothetical protein
VCPLTSYRARNWIDDGSYQSQHGAELVRVHGSHVPPVQAVEDGAQALAVHEIIVRQLY